MLVERLRCILTDDERAILTQKKRLHNGRDIDYYYGIGLAYLQKNSKETESVGGNGSGLLYSVRNLTEVAETLLHWLVGSDQQLIDDQKANVLGAAVGLVICKTQFEDCGKESSLVEDILKALRRNCKVEISVVDILGEYILYTHCANLMECLHLDCFEDLYVSYFDCAQMPHVGCIVGEFCDSALEAREQVAQQVLAKIKEMEVSKAPKRSREDTIVEELANATAAASGPALQNTRWKQQLLIILQKHGLREPLGSCLATHQEATRDRSILFFSVFRFPDSLKGSALPDVGTVKGAAVGSKKAAEDCVCRLVLEKFAIEVVSHGLKK